MDGTVAKSRKTGSAHTVGIAELRDALAAARERLVRAVDERSSERVLSRLRGRVLELLEKIEKLHMRDRFRR